MYDADPSNPNPVTPEPQANVYPPQAQAAPNYSQPYVQQDPAYAQQNYQYAPQPQPQPQQKQSNRTAGIGSAQKDKWVAGLLALFLGVFGIHKFYLGYKTEGIIMLLVSLIVGICGGLGILIMLVFSYIEAVRYLILTQEDFERIYVTGSKGWF